jgi:hypothetical protein
VSTKYEDDSYAVGKPSGYLYWQGDEDQRYIDGNVRTPHGFVSVYAEKDFLRLQFISDGRAHSRTWKQGFKHRHIVTLANRFANEIKEPA